MPQHGSTDSRSMSVTQIDRLSSVCLSPMGIKRLWFQMPGKPVFPSVRLHGGHFLCWNGTDSVHESTGAKDGASLQRTTRERSLENLKWPAALRMMQMNNYGHFKNKRACPSAETS